jgi:diphthamide biosynthesis enzyme Dph1/Dph2-like protein
MEYKLENLEKNYYLELDRIVSKIKESNAKTVLLQLPDGLKPWGPTLADYLENKTDAKISIWLGACFGSCDLPNSDCDLLVQFGHAAWDKGFSHTD